MDTGVMLVVAVAFVVGGLVKGLIGGGLPSVVVPMMAMVIDPDDSREIDEAAVLNSGWCSARSPWTALAPASTVLVAPRLSTCRWNTVHPCSSCAP